MTPFGYLVEMSLDGDISALLKDSRINTSEAMQLQMLRIMRGRPFKIELNAEPQTSVQGWSPDGVTWYPSEPGSFTTGGGVIPPEEK